jgi:hypothetical protein
VGKKSEEDRSLHYDTDCGQNSSSAVQGENRMWGEGCLKLHYVIRGHNHNFAFHAPYQMMDEGHSLQCGMDYSRSHGLGLHAKY